MTDAPTPPEQPTQPSEQPGPPPAYPAPPPAGPPGPHQAPSYGESAYGPPPDHSAMVPAGMPPEAYAHWGQRVGATLLDVALLIPFYIVAGVGAGIMGAGIDTTYDSFGVEHDHMTALGGIGLALMIVAYLAAIVFAIWNQIFRQGRTGSSLGKKWMNIRVVGERTGAPIGALMTFLRQICHIVDGLLCYIGYLWPLWDDKRQTFADKIMGTVVLPQREPR